MLARPCSFRCLGLPPRPRELLVRSSLNLPDASFDCVKSQPACLKFLLDDLARKMTAVLQAPKKGFFGGSKPAAPGGC